MVDVQNANGSYKDLMLLPDLSANCNAVWRSLLALLGEEDDADPGVAATRWPPARFSSHCRPAPGLVAWRRCCVQLSNSFTCFLSLSYFFVDPRATVVSLDGRSAYDTISRATILAKLRATVPSLLPFTRAMYARTSTYLLWDDEGRVHDIAQDEGVEQGDPLAPGLYFTRSASTTR